MGVSYFVFVLLLMHFLSSDAVENEPTCSKFPYEEQLLGKMTRVEVKMEQWDKELKKFEESILSVLEHRREDMETVLEEYRNLKDSQNKKLHDISLEQKKLKNDIANITTEGPGTQIVAFNAHLTTHGSYTYAENQIVKFPHIMLNVGNGYDATSGYFTAPVPGLYQFIAHVCQYKQHMVYAIVYEKTTVALSSVYESTSASCTSVGALVQMQTDERVCVKSMYGDNMLFSNQYRWPSFMGVLLHMKNN